MAAHISRHHVDWGETDAAGIVFYPNYFRWFDRATHELFRALGAPLPDLMREGWGVPLVEARARFLRPLRYGDPLEVESGIAEVRTRGLRIEHRITRDGELVAEGYEVRVWMQTALPPDLAPQAVPIPTAIRRILLDV